MTEEAFDVDALIAEIGSPEAAPEAPSEGTISDAQAETPEDKAADAETPADSAFSLTYKGKELGLTEDRYKAYAQKGKDYETKMHDFRVERKLFEAERDKHKESHANIIEINDYTEANPAFQKLIQDQWALIQSGQTPPMEPQTEVQVLKHQMAQLMETMGSQKEGIEARRVAELEATQEGAISKYREEHSSMDWETKDDDGQTLEDRIGQSMLDNGVKDFRIMADSLLLKEHMSRKVIEGKESAAKGIQKATKLGLGKVTAESQQSIKKAEDISKKSYDQLMAEAIAEMG